MSEPIIELDRFEQELEDQLVVIKTCQKDMKVDSCMKCVNFLECPIRLRYVSSVYSSMAKDTIGGFEF